MIPTRGNDHPSKGGFLFHAKNLAGLLTGAVTSEDMLEAFGLSQSISKEQMLNVWTEETMKLMSADKNALALLVKLRVKYILGALTNLTEQRYGADLKMGLYDYFDFSVLSYKVGIKKPDANFFLKALDQAGCLPQESVFIDDQAKNTEAATMLGIKSIQYDNDEDIQILLAKLRKVGVEV